MSQESTVATLTEYQSIDFAHNRYNPLTDKWVLVCPHRTLRPWQGQVEKSSEENQPEHDPNNPLCPGTRRGSGKQNPNYTETYVFENDFPALRESYDSSHPLLNDDSSKSHETDDLFRIKVARGTCRVICFHPKTNMSLPLMTQTEIVNVINVWIAQLNELAPRMTWVQIFENKGAIMGCSNPHPHCQVWASDFLPNELVAKDSNQRKYYAKHGRPLLLDYLQRELTNPNERVLLQNKHWVVLVPFWAFWPFETMIIPRRHIKRLNELTNEEKHSLAAIMKTLLIKYDNLFEVSFPYSMGWHGAPTGPHLNENQEHWQLHASYYPPLLRSATVKKFMVGYELFAQAQRDLTPEKAAEQIRKMSEVHYKERNTASA